MKKIISLFLALLGAVASSQAQTNGLATAVSWYFYPCSLPDVTTTEFGTARDNLITGIAFGGALDTHSRLQKTTGIEIRDFFDTGDCTVSTNSASTNYSLWRGQFNPASPINQHGNRIYAPVLMIGKNGKVSIDRLSYRVTSGLALLGNQSSLSGLDYSVSRIGIQAGPDGVLFTPDDVIVNSGAGTNLMDAIVFIGARAGAAITQPSDIATLNGEIGTNGVSINFAYQFNGVSNVLTGSMNTMLYPNNAVPQKMAHPRWVPFYGPNGILYSVVGPSGSTNGVLSMTRTLVHPQWVVQDGNAAEGSSGFAYYTHNPTNDMAFFMFK